MYQQASHMFIEIGIPRNLSDDELHHTSPEICGLEVESQAPFVYNEQLEVKQMPKTDCCLSDLRQTFNLYRYNQYTSAKHSADFSLGLHMVRSILHLHLEAKTFVKGRISGRQFSSSITLLVGWDPNYGCSCCPNAPTVSVSQSAYQEVSNRSPNAGWRWRQRWVKTTKELTVQLPST